MFHKLQEARREITGLAQVRWDDIKRFMSVKSLSWRCGSVGRGLASNAGSLEFDPQQHIN